MERVECRTLGPMGTNCCFLIEETTGEALIIDPADQPDVIRSFLEEQQLDLIGILLTHGHFDHIGAVAALKEAYQVPVYAHEEEKELLADPSVNLSAMFGKPISIQADEWMKDCENLQIGSLKLQVLHTPGHTRGSVCYLTAEGTLFSGDTLFRGTTGRVDFPTGDGAAIVRSIREKLLVLPDETPVYPGHEQKTRMGNEKSWIEKI